MFLVASSFLLLYIDCAQTGLSAEHLQPSGTEPFFHKAFGIQQLEVTFLDTGPFFSSEHSE